MIKLSNKLFCFSPAAMLAIFLTEMGLAIYVLARYTFKWSGYRVVAAMLVLLALFQLAEYHVCGQSSNSSLAWTRVGYVAITLLPPLAIHLIHIIAQKKARAIVWASYIAGFVVAMVFGFSSTAFASHVCAGNYTIFSLISPLGGIYFAYYYALLFLGMGLCLYYVIGASQKIQKALVLQMVGYLSFLLPTGLVNTVSPETIQAIPSIMCGFAVIYALILVFGILPLIKPTDNSDTSSG